MSENVVSFGNNALFDMDLDMLLPDELDVLSNDEKYLYVKVNCKTKEEVKEIINIFEKMKIEKKRIVISA